MVGSSIVVLVGTGIAVNVGSVGLAFETLAVARVVLVASHATDVGDGDRCC